MVGSKILKGFLWTYGAQILSNLVQFGYAAVTSRVIHADGFGSFAIALSTSSLISLIANGGLAQTASRLSDVNNLQTKSLQSYAAISGVIASAFTFFTADFWAMIWSSHDVALDLRILSFSVLIGPFAVLASGVTRRNGYYRFNGMWLFISNLIGMFSGSLLVLFSRQSWALLLTPLLSQLILTVALTIRNREQLLGFGKINHLGEFSNYNINIILAKVSTYAVVTIPTWVFAKFFGVGVVGDINRAGIFTTTPLYQVQVALVQALSPEFRHDIKSPDRARRVWTDLLILISWFAFPISCALGALSFVFLPMILGSEWELAALYSIPLALIAGIQILVWVLDSAIETIGNFKTFWLSLTAASVCNLGGAMIAIASKDLSWVFWSLGSSLIAQHLFQVIGASGRGYIDRLKLALGYLGALTYSVLLAASIFVSLISFTGNSIGIELGATAICALAIQLSLSLLYMTKMPPMKILARYNLVPKKSRGY